MTKMKEMPNVEYTMSLKYQRQATDTGQDHPVLSPRSPSQLMKKFDGFVAVVKDRLAAYPGIAVTGHAYIIIPLLYAQSTNEEFERLYHVKLKLETMLHPDTGRLYLCFLSDKEPTVPKGLEDVVEKITIANEVLVCSKYYHRQ
ncbi:hypothetical protein HY639_04280 [Candidatus Woesearchaeota archaeon]|nr:hypothetical protein [Candidatus Woesearchaeota archaeon]